MLRLLCKAAAQFLKYTRQRLPVIISLAYHAVHEQVVIYESRVQIIKTIRDQEK